MCEDNVYTKQYILHPTPDSTLEKTSVANHLQFNIQTTPHLEWHIASNWNKLMAMTKQVFHNSANLSWG